MAFLAFEAINQVRITITITMTEVGNEGVIALVGRAFTREEGNGEATLLASVNARLGFRERQTMDAAIFQLMYDLDAALAAGEFAKILKQQ